MNRTDLVERLSETSSGAKRKHFVDKHQGDLIQRVKNIGPILDHLLREAVIQEERYDHIWTIPTTQEKMRELYRGPLKAGDKVKEIFYTALEGVEKFLVADLKEKES
uniref:CARD domain-containing protein n=1 Tax=Monopterus albus TaxID=43700 RepID=A0A3Q3KAN1_MONAL